ncbi:Putative epoxide hydrolase [Fusarium oxysporum f. sp. cubense race 1]|uniref:Putative epoxide hydrolase n=1 Tax=Fusarium oxysporum f. sp. cubense (strain race 1) TaxID=1229664 RepID=N4UTI2_FUSC1|nr:Putative epoxide hydrolase [Fusarium oxysporum f. sp. cubense race 1]
MPYTLPETAKPFTLRISEEEYSQLQELLRLSRIGPKTWENQHQDRRYGIPHQWLTSTKDYWLNKFDWRRQEARINSLPNYKISIQDDLGKGDIDLHFIGIFSQRDNAIPIVLLHGWPGSFLEFIPMLELLQKKYDPSSLPYHVIVPSLPGYTLSSGPSQTKAWNSKDAARVINKAVTSLGFTRYAVQGGDVGSLIAATLATTYDSVAAIHLNLLPSLDKATVDDPSLSATDKAAIKRAEQRFLTPTTGAALLQSTRPATIGAMVSSSPMALLSWIGEKFLEWPDDAIDIDEILTNVSLYWFTDTMPRCIYTYRGTFINDHQYSFPSFKQPFGFSWFLQELIPTPKELAKKKGNLVFYQQHEKGGHFAALERPIEFLQDIEDFLSVAWPKND